MCRYCNDDPFCDEKEEIIYNKQKGTGYIWIDHNFVKQVSMFDKAVVNVHGSIKEGYIALISRRGVNINLGYGDRFFKWCHVVAVKKSVK